MTSRIPARRFGQPEEVANVIAWLLGDGSSYVNGAAIPVDGGLTAGLRAMTLNNNEQGRTEMRAATILQPLAHVGQPGEEAALAHFLISADCGLITGQAIAVDGGKSAGISPAVQQLVASAARGPASDGQ